jgi:hypothetical protein
VSTFRHFHQVDVGVEVIEDPEVLATRVGGRIHAK